MKWISANNELYIFNAGYQRDTVLECCFILGWYTSIIIEEVPKAESYIEYLFMFVSLTVIKWKHSHIWLTYKFWSLQITCCSVNRDKYKMEAL